MKIVKIVSFICVLALALTLVSSFAFAAAPEAEVEVESSEIMPRAGTYEVKTTRTYMYNNHSESSGYVHPAPLPVETRLTNTVDFGTWVLGTATWEYAGTQRGYVLRSHLRFVG